MPEKVFKCTDAKCQRNFFWDKLGLKKSQETDISDKYHNCMLFLDDELTLDQIGRIWGMSRERIRQIEEKAIFHLMEGLLKTKDKESEGLWIQIDSVRINKFRNLLRKRKEKIRKMQDRRKKPTNENLKVDFSKKCLRGESKNQPERRVYHAKNKGGC